MSTFYNLQEASKKLGISRHTLRDIINNNEIGYTIIGKRKKFTDKDIEDYKTKNKR